MIVELTSTQRDILLRLLDAALEELGPEIHHTWTYKDDLKEQRRTLLNLRALLTDVPPMVPEPSALTPTDTFQR